MKIVLGYLAPRCLVSLLKSNIILSSFSILHVYRPRSNKRVFHTFAMDIIFWKGMFLSYLYVPCPSNHSHPQIMRQSIFPIYPSPPLPFSPVTLVNNLTRCTRPTCSSLFCAHTYMIDAPKWET